jgi:cyclase
MQKVTDNVYVETGFRGCNCSFVVTSEGVVAIDTPMVPSEAKKWAAGMAEFGPMRYVINGEPHGDHVSGNCYMGGVLIGHEGTREAIKAAKREDAERMLKMLAPDTPLDKDFRYRPSEITFTERLTLYLGKHTFHLINLPGHTPYQAAVYVPEERVVFTSDNVVAGLPFFHQAVPDKWLKSIKALEKLDIDKVIGGHGPVQDKRYLPEMSKLIKTWVGVVKEAIDTGMSLEEAQDKVTYAKEFPQLPRDERTAGIIKMNVGAIYKYLKG